MTLVSADSAFRQYEVAFPCFGLELWSPGNPLFPRPEIETIAVKPEQFLETIATPYPWVAPGGSRGWAFPAY